MLSKPQLLTLSVGAGSTRPVSNICTSLAVPASEAWKALPKLKIFSLVIPFNLNDFT